MVVADRELLRKLAALVVPMFVGTGCAHSAPTPPTAVAPLSSCMDGTVAMGPHGCEQSSDGGFTIELGNSLAGYVLDRLVVTVGTRTLFSTNDEALLRQKRLTILRGSLPEEAKVKLRLLLHGTNEAKARLKPSWPIRPLAGVQFDLKSTHKLSAGAKTLEINLLPDPREETLGGPIVRYAER